MRSPTPPPLLLPALALALSACLGYGAAAGHWSGGDRAVQGYTDSKGNHYPWLPYQPLDFYSSEDGDVSNQISGHHAVVPQPNPRYSSGGWRWRHRAGRHRKVSGGGGGAAEGGGGGGGRGGRRRGKVAPVPAASPAVSSSALHPAPVASPRAVVRTMQRGWAYVPHRGATVDVPRRTASSKVYRGTITTSVEPPVSGSLSLTGAGAGRGGATLVRAAAPAAPEGPVRDAPAAEAEAASGEDDAAVCVRCPGDLVLVASRGRRMVALDQPQFRPCPRGKSPRVEHMSVEWREGPKPGTLVPEGVHAMVGEVSYRGRPLRSCSFNVFVVVRECSPLRVGAGVRAQCSAGAAWGSRCSFSCADGRRPLGARSTLCTDALRWTHAPPRCPPTPDNSSAIEEQAAGAAGAAGSGCPSPLGPRHGRLLCQAPLDGIPASSQEQLLPERTQCEFVCEEGFALAHAHRHLALIECRNGAWNTSADPQCLSVTGEHQHPNAIQRDAGLKQHKQHKQRRRHKDARLKSLNEACRPNPCQGGGTCLRGPAAAPALCLCSEHRQGEFCEFARCMERCENGGKCVVVDEKAICFCPAHYSGEHCEIPDAR